MGYSDTFKVLIIYVPGERHIEVSQDVTFHEEASFKRLKDLEYDIETKDHETHILENHDTNSSPSDI